MQSRNYCFVCLGMFLAFQQTPADPTRSSDGGSLEQSTDAVISNPACPSGCVQCSTSNGCVTCQGTHFLFLQWYGIRQTGKCLRKCPAGYYGRRIKGHGKCFQCDQPNCATCSNQSTCTSCNASFFVASGKCVAQCPKAQPHANAKNQCQKKVNCEVGPWSSWGPCTRENVTCESQRGCRSRTRQVLQKASPNGRKCPPIVQSKACKRKVCECKAESKIVVSDPLDAGKLDKTRQDFAKLSTKHQKCKKQLKECKQKNKNQKKGKSEVADVTSKEIAVTPKPKKQPKPSS